MTKEEIEKAIEDGESVWVVENIEESPNLLYEVNIENIVAASGIGLIYFNEVLNSKFRASFSQCFKTQLEALHYANHANMTRTETMPFLTWKEFKSGKNIALKAKNGHEFLLKAKQESIYLWWLETNNIWATWDLTEENFYKAYDECVKLFLGRED